MNRLKVWISEHQRMIVMGVAAFIILCVGCLVIREYQLKRVYNQAISYYEENDLIAFESIRYRLSTKYGEDFDHFLLEEANQLFEEYRQEQVTYHEAIGGVERIEAFANRPSLIQDVQTKVDELKQSRQQFKEAEKLAIQKKWEEAYHLYLQVIEEDPNYEKSRQLADTAKRWWLQDLLVEAVTYYEKRQYEKSLTVIEQALSLSEGDEQFLQLKEDVHLAMEKGTLESKWSEVKEILTESIQSGIESLQNIFEKIFKR